MATVVTTRRSGIEFHHPIAFWVGTLMLGAGVCAHIPMFMMAAPLGFKMVDMPVDGVMIAGMFLIVAGLILSVYGLIPRQLASIRAHGVDGPAISLVSADNAPLTRAHGTLFMVLIVALIVDIMKPATLGFVMPGMADEYNITRQTASWLAITALTGTAVGSVIWGLIADTLGRRSAILISSLMFVGTAICGAMPAFEWNLFMCFLMGASAGGLLPIAFTLMAEIVPSRHRGWMLVLLGGIGTTGGYLAASACAAWLEPQFGWRVLWFLNLPTGLLLIALNRYLPESPRFLVHMGRNDEARHVLEGYGVTVVTAEKTNPSRAPDKSHHWMRLLFGRRVFALTVGLILCGLAWGLVNFGFLLWLPSNLRGLGLVGGAAEALLAKSAFLALPGVLLVTYLYHKWSTIKTITLFVAVTAAALMGFFLLGSGSAHSSGWFVALTVVLLISVSGVIAMLIPYATEIYPLQVRGTGSGLVAGSSKAGGIAAAGLGVMGLFGSLTASSLSIAAVLAASAAVLAVKGIETRNRDLEDIYPANSKEALTLPSEK
jgi:putative MFS transporter